MDSSAVASRGLTPSGRRRAAHYGVQTPPSAKFVEPNEVLTQSHTHPKKSTHKGCFFIFLAVGVGFEPTDPFGSTVFKTAAFDHSASPPKP